ncbi:helix-turn-helix domain-containing protein [Streptomyces sp. MT29]|nr:helix-turn-helix domain-containing protein [Streptomyces sp. MT29]
MPPPEERLRLREAAGFSRAHIAATVGVGRQTIANWERGAPTRPRPPASPTCASSRASRRSIRPPPPTEIRSRCCSPSSPPGPLQHPQKPPPRCLRRSPGWRRCAVRTDAQSRATRARVSSAVSRRPTSPPTAARSTPGPCASPPPPPRRPRTLPPPRRFRLQSPLPLPLSRLRLRPLRSGSRRSITVPNRP